jgi:hypothetical protein
MRGVAGELGQGGSGAGAGGRVGGDLRVLGAEGVGGLVCDDDGGAGVRVAHEGVAFGAVAALVPDAEEAAKESGEDEDDDHYDPLVVLGDPVTGQ